jgi:AcrR family transcriptional regulator
MTNVSQIFIMPKQTFYNLPEKKREKILSASMEEFASAGYDLSSIQKIIKASGIPRGSFYQYFEDKADLFEEVMVVIAKRKMVYMQPVLDRNDEFGLFGILKELAKAGVEFGMNNPEAFQIAKGLSSSKTLDLKSFVIKFRERILERLDITEESLYYTAIQNSMKWGEIDSRYSFETILRYSNMVLESMSEQYWSHMASHNDVHAGDEILDEMVHFLKYGLSSNNQPGKEAGKDD